MLPAVNPSPTAIKPPLPSSAKPRTTNRWPGAPNEDASAIDSQAEPSVDDQTVLVLPSLPIISNREPCETK